MIVEKVIATKQAKIRNYPTHVNRASELGHACLRYLVLQRVAWEQASLYDVNLQFIFDEGNVQEKAVLKDLAEAGIDVIEQQRTYTWKEYQITGHIDGKVYFDLPTPEKPGILGPLEIKGINSFDWQKLDPSLDASQLLDSKKHWLRKYPAQLQLYLILDNDERGVFLFKDKSTGQLKEIFAKLDFEYCEMLIQKAIQINQYVKHYDINQEIPPPIKYDGKICNSCKFFETVCMGMGDLDVKPTELDPEDKEELANAVDTLFFCKQAHMDFEAAQETLKTLTTDRERIIIESDSGVWELGGQWIEPKGRNKYWKPKYNLIQAEVGNDE